MPNGRSAAALVACLLMLTAVRVSAQGVTPGPPGPFVLDVRGTTLGVPQTSDFYPDIPGETIVPARGFGLEAGAHIFPLSVGGNRLGIGADLFWVRGTATTPVTSTTGTAPPSDLPDVQVTMWIVAPQVSVNFGTSRGWSYLTAGAGRGSVDTAAGLARLSTSSVAVNTGGGARWFLNDHAGVGFDLRIHWLGGNTLFAASAGLSFR